MSGPVWICDHCGQPVRANLGWTIINTTDALNSPTPIAWGVYCYEHAPTEQFDDYELNLTWMATNAGEAEWRAHVARKPWFANTIWPNPYEREAA